MPKKRSTDAAAVRQAAAAGQAVNAADAADASKAAVDEAAAKPSRKEKRIAAGYKAAAAAGVAIPVNKTKDVKIVAPTPKPHKRAAKDQAAVAGANQADVDRIRNEREQAQADADTARQGRELDQIAIAAHTKHVAEITKLKKKFPNSAAVQALQPKTLEEVRRDIAGGPKPVEATRLTPTQERNVRINTAVRVRTQEFTDASGVVENLAKRPNIGPYLPGYRDTKIKIMNGATELTPEMREQLSSAVPGLVERANSGYAEITSKDLQALKDEAEKKNKRGQRVPGEPAERPTSTAIPFTPVGSGAVKSGKSSKRAVTPKGTTKPTINRSNPFAG